MDEGADTEYPEDGFVWGDEEDQLEEGDIVVDSLKWDNEEDNILSENEDFNDFIDDEESLKQYAEFVKASIYVYIPEDDEADPENEWWFEEEYGVRHDEDEAADKDMGQDVSMEETDNATDSGVGKDETSDDAIVKLDLPKDFITFRSFIFKYSHKYLEQGSEYISELLEKLNGLRKGDYRRVSEFNKHAVATILGRILTLLKNCNLEPDLIASEWTVKQINREETHAKIYLESTFNSSCFSEYVVGHLVRIMLKDSQLTAIVESAESKTVFKADVGETYIKTELIVLTDLGADDVVNEDKVRVSQMIKISCYLLQALELYSKKWSTFIEEQLIRPKFNIQPCGLALMLSDRSKERLWESELEGLQKAIDTISLGNGTSFCILDYRYSKRPKEWLCQLAVEIVLQFVRIEKQLKMSNLEAFGLERNAKVEDNSILESLRHKFFLITNDKLSICKIVNDLRDLKITVYHATDELCYSPSEDEVHQRAISLLKATVEKSGTSDDLENQKNALQLMVSPDDVNGLTKREYEKAKMVRKYYKQVAKEDILKESDLVIGTIEEISNDNTFRSSLANGEIPKYYSAILYQASTLDETDLLTLGHFGVQKFILLDNKTGSNSLMDRMLTYYQNLYHSLPKGAKSSVVSSWKPPQAPTRSAYPIPFKRTNSGHIKDDRHYNSSQHNSHYRPHENHLTRSNFRNSHHQANHFDRNSTTRNNYGYVPSYNPATRGSRGHYSNYRPPRPQSRFDDFTRTPNQSSTFRSDDSMRPPPPRFDDSSRPPHFGPTNRYNQGPESRGPFYTSTPKRGRFTSPRGRGFVPQRGTGPYRGRGSFGFRGPRPPNPGYRSMPPPPSPSLQQQGPAQAIPLLATPGNRQFVSYYPSDNNS